MANATPSSPALLLLLLLLSAAAAAAAAASASDSGLGVSFGASARDAPLSLMIPSSCRGSSVGECAVFEEVSRRELGGTGGDIGYAALRPDNVPCSQRGTSYTNCRPGAQANPYSRGCSTINHCRSS